VQVILMELNVKCHLRLGYKVILAVPSSRIRLYTSKASLGPMEMIGTEMSPPPFGSVLYCSNPGSANCENENLQQKNYCGWKKN
jgi:hypothetical protein